MSTKLVFLQICGHLLLDFTIVANSVADVQTLFSATTCYFFSYISCQARVTSHPYSFLPLDIAIINMFFNSTLPIAPFILPFHRCIQPTEPNFAHSANTASTLVTARNSLRGEESFSIVFTFNTHFSSNSPLIHRYLKPSTHHLYYTIFFNDNFAEMVNPSSYLPPSASPCTTRERSPPS